MDKDIRFFTVLLLSFLGLASTLTGQEDFENWMHSGPNKASPNGVRTTEWYEAMPRIKAKKVIVAVMDTGVDINHPDLSDNIWINTDEIPGNGKDDDANGYIDDMNGWNFLGGPDGGTVVNESFEVTRVYAMERDKWSDVVPEKLKGKKRKEYEAFKERADLVETKLQNANEQLAQVQALKTMVVQTLEAAKAELKGDSLDIVRLEKSANEEVQTAAKIIRNVEEQGVKVESIDWLLEIATEQFDTQIAESEKIINFDYSLTYNSREIIGDDYYDFSNRTYGNNTVDVAFAYHGTHVAGIIGAVRHNGEGMDGIADNVAIMAVNVVPDGDERDKDVANGIYYAVDNGAQVINMSFGKGYSPEKKLVDDAMRYAAKHDVLIVHGAGNEGANMEEKLNFPNDTYLRKPLIGRKRAPNMISVGAVSPEGGESSVAEFSNYGKTEVDVFAPGVYIYSTTPDSTYDYASGTSMAAPVVSGVAALMRSRYPNLSAVQVKDILMKSTRPLPEMVILPGTFELVKGTELAVSGGMVDVVSAMNLADKTKGKAKLSKRKKAVEYEVMATKA